MNKIDWNQIKHGDTVTVTIKDESNTARVEERFISQSPSKKTALFVIMDGIPHVPIEVNDFLKNYGTITK